MPLRLRRGLSPEALLTVLCAWLPGCLAAQDLKPFVSASPESVGLSSERLELLPETMLRLRADGQLVGGELLIARGRSIVMHRAFGMLDRDDETPWELGTICRIRSMTKPFVGTAIQVLRDEGKLALDDPAARFLPSFDSEASKAITIRHLLQHEAGFSQPGYPEDLTSYPSLRAAVDALGASGPEWEPGTRFVYSDASTAILGAVVAEISGRPLEQFLSDRILEPLGLSDTFCGLTDDDPRRSRVGSTYVQTGERIDEYWDRDDPQQMQFFRASGGIYSTALDQAKWLRSWLDRDGDGRTALLPGAIVDEARRPTGLSQAGPGGGGSAYGQHWQVFDGSRPGREVFGHGGSDGTLVLADPTRDLVVCLFTQTRRGVAPRELLASLADALPQAFSLDGRALYKPELPSALLEQRVSDLRAAARDRLQIPEDPTAHVWFGRRLAYLGDIRGAIVAYSRAITRFPDEPRLYRHRGHRFLTVRELGLAIDDLERAAGLIEGTEDRVEPDGLPNARGIPTSTLHTNVYYHLGLAHFVSRDFEAAVDAYRRCLAASKNPDMLCATTQWLYASLRRLGRDDEAKALLEPITEDLDVIENHAYHRLLLMAKGLVEPAELLRELDEGDGIQNATLAFGVAHFLLVEGDEEQASRIFRRIIDGGSWAAFGYLAAESEL